MKRLLWDKLNIQLFADGGEGGAVELSGDDFADAEQSKNVSGDDEFNTLINGKFKEQFTKKTQEIIDKRFKQTKELEAFKQKVSPAVKNLMEKYGLNEGEEEKLLQALSNGEGDGNESVGINGEERVATDSLRRKASEWIMQSEKMKDAFPDFDLRQELRENKLFSQLLLCGADLKSAYEAVHRQEILAGAMAYTAGKVREQIVQGIQAKSVRPFENGVISSGAVVSGVDVNALTSNDILKILKQVENGASISF